MPFVDLDVPFKIAVEDISACLGTYGYQASANQNIRVYLDTLASFPDEAVLALSSGFMTYAEDAHPDYRDQVSVHERSPCLTMGHETSRNTRRVRRSSPSASPQIAMWPGRRTVIWPSL